MTNGDLYVNTKYSRRTVIEHIKQPTNLQQITFVLFGSSAYNAFEQALKKLERQ